MLVFLNFNGDLLYFYLFVYSLILLDYYPNVNIFDFILMSSPAKTSDAIYILALSNANESAASRSIQVIKLPGFVIINSVKVSVDCWLVRPENKVCKLYG